jgi:hypothetical protein
MSAAFEIALTLVNAKSGEKTPHACLGVTIIAANSFRGLESDTTECLLEPESLAMVRCVCRLSSLRYANGRSRPGIAESEVAYGFTRS